MIASLALLSYGLSDAYHILNQEWYICFRYKWHIYSDTIMAFYLDFATKQEGLRRFIDSEGLLSPE